jgi:hypothetical protein
VRACVEWHDSKSRTVVLDGGVVGSGVHEDTSITMPLVEATLNVALWLTFLTQVLFGKIVLRLQTSAGGHAHRCVIGNRVCSRLDLKNSHRCILLVFFSFLYFSSLSLNLFISSIQQFTSRILLNQIASTLDSFIELSSGL